MTNEQTVRHGLNLQVTEVMDAIAVLAFDGNVSAAIRQACLYYCVMEFPTVTKRYGVVLQDVPQARMQETPRNNKSG